jgi:hypothetical protein
MSSITDPRAADTEESSAPLDPTGWASLAAGLLVALITFFTSYSHVGDFQERCHSLAAFQVAWIDGSA